MPPRTSFIRSTAILWSLVIGNLAALLLLIFLSFFAIRSSPGIPSIHWTFAAAGGMVCAQVLLLALWTAFYDPKWPVRWLAISAILLTTDLIVALELSALVHWHYEHIYGLTLSWVDGIAYHFSVTTAGVALIVALGLTMFLHASCWPLRSMLGWRIEFAGADTRLDSARQFSIVQLFAWVGFFGVLFFLLRSLLALEWFLEPIILCVIGSVAAAVNVVPWFVLLRFEQVRRWHLLLPGLLLGGSLLQTWVEKEITGNITGAPPLTGPNFYAEYFAFNFVAAGVAALNLFILRASGARLRSFTARQPIATLTVPASLSAEGSRSAKITPPPSPPSRRM